MVARGYPSLVRILMVDDVEPFRRCISSVLKTRAGLHIAGEAADGIEAVQKATDLKPDVILLDIGLPIQNGIEAAHRIRQTNTETKIIFLTQNNDVDIAQAALSNGVQGYVLKQDAGSELLPAIEAVLRGEKFVSGRLETLI